MLDAIRKKFSKLAQANTQEEIVTTMTTEKDQAAELVTDNTTAELTAQLSNVTEAMTALQGNFAALQSKYDLATAALAQSAEAQATLVANAKAAVLTARTEKLSAIMGDVQGPKTAASLESLDDEAFAVVLSSYAANFEAESKSEMFSEKGVAAEAAPVVEEDVTTRLAASLAAQFKSK